MKLAVISHTEHYRDENGQIVGWGPTISELNYLSDRFETIYHLAFLHETKPPPSSLPYTASNIIFVPLPVSGGKSILEKLTIVKNLPKTLAIIKSTLKAVDVFQFRAPTGMGVFVIPWLSRRAEQQGWFKYAGNWKQENPPLGYRLQRRFLKRQSRIVTINGSWSDQPKHCLTFENPCLQIMERKEGLEIIRSKSYAPSFSFCFVGRLEDEKGVQRIIDAFSNITDASVVKDLHFIGNGPKFDDYRKQCELAGISAIFHGFLSRSQVFEIYRKCEFLLLPSTASEGFPKVIAEGMNYGCIPIITNVSSITQYVTPENGFVVEPATSQRLLEVLEIAINCTDKDLQTLAIKGHGTAKNFTFEHYAQRILVEILQHK